MSSTVVFFLMSLLSLFEAKSLLVDSEYKLQLDSKKQTSNHLVSFEPRSIHYYRESCASNIQKYLQKHFFIYVILCHQNNGKLFFYQVVSCHHACFFVFSFPHSNKTIHYDGPDDYHKKN